MKIKAFCRFHKDAKVFLLDGTVTFFNDKGLGVPERTERSVMINIDEYNLYCTGEGVPNHDFGWDIQT